MSVNKAMEVLESKKLRKTTGRADIISVLMGSGVALTEAHIEEKLGASCDRATVYRNLKTFLEKGIIHRVLDESGPVKYALCPETCSIQSHSHEHVHFKCQSCGETQCMEGIPIQKVKLPSGFEMSEANLLIVGFCKNCGNKSNALD